MVDHRTLQTQVRIRSPCKDENKEKVIQYIFVLKLWAKVSEVEAKNKANVIKYHAFQRSPDYFEELNDKFREALDWKEEGASQIMQIIDTVLPEDTSEFQSNMQ